MVPLGGKLHCTEYHQDLSNGTMVGQPQFFSHHHNVGDGRIIIGRQYTGNDGIYASIEIDELRFFNRTLTEAQITMLSQLPQLNWYLVSSGK